MDKLSLYSIDLAGQFDNNNEGFAEIFNLIPVMSGVTLNTTKAVGDLAEDITHTAGESIALSDIKTESVELGKIGFSSTKVATSYQDIQAFGEENAVGKKDKRLIQLVGEHIENTLIENLQTVAGDDTLEVEGLQALLAQAKGKVQSVAGFQGASVFAMVNTSDFYKYLGNANLTTQKVFGLMYVEDYLGYDKIFITNKVEEGKVLATSEDNLNLAYVPVNSESFSSLKLQAADSQLVGFKHYLVDDTGDVMSKVHFGLESFPERADAVILGTLTEPEEDEL